MKSKWRFCSILFCSHCWFCFCCINIDRRYSGQEFIILDCIWNSFSFHISGVMGAKNTSNILPFCHPLPLEYVDIKIQIDDEKIRTLRIDCVVKTTHKTGVEMEAIIGVTHAAVCIYDMLKAVSHNIVISQVKLISKSGGKSSYVDNQSSNTSP